MQRFAQSILHGLQAGRIDLGIESCRATQLHDTRGKVDEISLR